MDLYQFIASLVQSIAALAWPAALFGSVWLFRKQLIEMLPNFRAKYKDIEIDFRLESARKEAAELLRSGLPPAAESTPEEKNRFEQIATLSPRAAILEIRADLEDTVRTFAAKVAELPSETMPLAVLTRILRTLNILDPHTFALLDDLRAIGNTAAHRNDKAFTKGEADQFRQLANQVMTTIAEASMKATLK